MGSSNEMEQVDLIDRQAAIDAVKKNTFRLVFSEEQNCEGHVAWSAEAVYSDVIEGALLELPSAQPEQNVYVVTYQDGDEEPVLSVFNNEVAAIAYRDEEGKNHDRIWLDEAPIFSKTLVNGRWFG